MDKGKKNKKEGFCTQCGKSSILSKRGLCIECRSGNISNGSKMGAIVIILKGVKHD